MVDYEQIASRREVEALRLRVVTLETAMRRIVASWRLVARNWERSKDVPSADAVAATFRTCADELAAFVEADSGPPNRSTEEG